MTFLTRMGMVLGISAKYKNVILILESSNDSYNYINNYILMITLLQI